MEGGTNLFEVVHARRICSETELDYELGFSSNLVSNDWKLGSYIELPSSGGKTNEYIRLKIDAL